MPKIKRTLVIIANPPSQYDKRSEKINLLCKSFIETLQQSGTTVDVLDLYNEDFNPVRYPDEKDSMTLEYQIRTQKADLIAIFHPIWWGSMPAILKGFFDKVFQSGFAYTRHEHLDTGLLKGKKAIVFAFSSVPKWHISILQSNSFKHTWQRSLFDYCGIKSQIYLYGNMRTVSDETIHVWRKQIVKIAKKLNPVETESI